MKSNSKFIKQSLICAVLCFIIGSCQKIDNTPILDDSTIIMPALSFDKLILGNANSNARIVAVNTPAPTVKQIITKVGCDNCTTLNSVLIPYISQQNYMDIIGTNFGSSIGRSIEIFDVNGKAQSSYAFGFLSWTDTSIRLQSASMSLSTLPMTLSFKITTSDGRVVTTTQNVEPVISQKRYGSEPYFVNAARIQMGLQPLPTGLYITGLALSGNNLSTFNRGDVWLFPSISKVSIITSVNSKTTNISKNVAGQIDNIEYSINSAEYPNGVFKAVNLGRSIIVRRTTTIFTNAPARVTYQLITAPSAAFNSLKSGQVATSFYR